MDKEIWSIEINGVSSICTFDTGVYLDIDCKGDARVSYTPQTIDIYVKIYGKYEDFRMKILKGCIWGPGVLTQMSDMTLKFVMK